jgi:rhodanese-related sulfurtransferase
LVDLPFARLAGRDRKISLHRERGNYIVQSDRGARGRYSHVSTGLSLAQEDAVAELAATIFRVGDTRMTDVRTLSTEELQQRLDQGDRPQFWNVLTNQYFTGELIPGSRRVPLDTIGRDTTAIPKDAEIITYCGGSRCPQSTQAAQRLIELGYTNVRAYKEGLDGWKAAGRSVEKIQEPAPAA